MARRARRRTTTLADWRSGTDVTKINGGSIAANSISANSLTVGLRGLSISGLQFNYDKVYSILKWSSGTVSYVNDSGNFVSDAILAGQFQYSVGTVIVAWKRGITSLITTTDIDAVKGAEFVRFATYRGGSDLIATYGRTQIDGNQITTGSLTADLVTAGEFITNNAQIKGGIIQNVHLAGNITFDKMAGGTLSVADAIRIGGDRFVILSQSQKIEIRDSQSIYDSSGFPGQIRLRLGKTGSGATDYGIEIYDAAGNIMLGTGGFGNIPANAINIPNLSSLSANLGSITAGRMQSTDGQFVIDLNNKFLSISTS